MIDEFASMGLMTKVDGEGRVYPYSESANTVLNVLLRKLEEYGVKIVCDAFVNKITPIDGKWKAICVKGEYIGDKAIFACGSNATSGIDSLNLISSLGHSVTPFRCMRLLR